MHQLNVYLHKQNNRTANLFLYITVLKFNISRLQHICKEESVQCTEEVLRKLIEASGGDMRRAITSLQSCARLKGTDTQISVDDVYEVTGIVPEKWLKEFLEVCKKKDFDELQQFVETLMLEAYSALQVEYFCILQ